MTSNSRDTSSPDSIRRAELAEELGFYPASLKPEDIERHRRQNAELESWESRARASSLTREQVAKKYAHLVR